MDDIIIDTEEDPLTSANEREISPSSSSVFHHTANIQHLSSSLVPTSPASIFASFVIVFVIIFVTILPILNPQNQFSTTTELYDYQTEDTDKVIKGNQTASNSTSNEHLDVRCKCICPPMPVSTPSSTETNSNLTDKTSSKLTNTRQRRLYVSNSPPRQCNCDNVVLPQLVDLKSLSKDFCSNCQCRYQSRNTKNIKRNVVFFIAVLSGLTIYMLIQYLFKYFRITRRSLPRRLKWLSFQITEDD